MDNETRLYRIVHDLRRQYRDPGAYTVGCCSTEGCTESSFGSGRCPKCLERELEEVVGTELAAEYHKAVAHTHMLLRGLFRAIGA